MDMHLSRKISTIHVEKSYASRRMEMPLVITLSTTELIRSGRKFTPTDFAIPFGSPSIQSQGNPT